MSDLKLFLPHEGIIGELESSSAPLEKGLQTQFETHLDTLLGVRFLASEYATSHGGRMDMGPELSELLADAETFLLGRGDDVTKKVTQTYLAYRRIKNFACVELRPTLNQLKLYAKLDPDTVALEDGFTRDVRGTGHFGTGDLEITIGSHADLDRAKPLIERAYEEG